MTSPQTSRPSSDTSSELTPGFVSVPVEPVKVPATMEVQPQTIQMIFGALMSCISLGFHLWNNRNQNPPR